jgi:hypothetical protein
VFENAVLRRIFGPKRKEVTGSRRDFHNEEVRDLNLHSQNIIMVMKLRGMKWGGRHVAFTRERKMRPNLYLEDLNGRDHLGERLSCRWESNIKMDLNEIGSENVHRSHVAQDRDQWWALVSTVINIRVQYIG